MLNSGSGGTAVQLPRSLPRGRNALPRDVVLVSQSARLLEGVIGAVAQKGYAATTVADIVGRAGVSRGTFYGRFRDKEDCFLAAYEAGSRHLFRAVAGAGVELDEPVARLRAGTRAYLEALASAPAWSRANLIEVRAVPAAVETRRRAHANYVDLIRRWREWAAPRMQGHPVLDAAHEAAVDAVNEMVARHVLRGAFDELPGLEPTILYIDLALLGFPEQAAALAERNVPVMPKGGPR